MIRLDYSRRDGLEGEWSEIEEEMERDGREQEREAVERRRKVKYFRQLLGGLISVRRQLEVGQGQTEVLQEHRLFRIVQQWRKIAAEGRKKQLQAEIMLERKEWKTKRQCLKEWMNQVRKRKLAEQHYIYKVFQALKLTCCSEYAVRVRKIQLQTALSNSRGREFIRLLQSERTQMERKREIATNHHRSRLLEICYNALQTTQAKGKRSRLRYQEYKLAHLYHVHSLLRKAWLALSS